MDNNIKHHGIRGMRWGVRRYQNKDGSLTAAGKKRKTLQKYSDDKREHDQVVYGRGGVKRIEKRMNKGASHTKAELAEVGRNWVIGTISGLHNGRGFA